MILLAFTKIYEKIYLGRAVRARRPERTILIARTRPPRGGVAGGNPYESSDATRSTCVSLTSGRTAEEHKANAILQLHRALALLPSSW